MHLEPFLNSILPRPWVHPVIVGLLVSGAASLIWSGVRVTRRGIHMIKMGLTMLLLLVLLPLPAEAIPLTVESGSIRVAAAWDQEPDGQIGGPTGRWWAAVRASHGPKLGAPSGSTH
jgi:hypothetical protein